MFSKDIKALLLINRFVRIERKGIKKKKKKKKRSEYEAMIYVGEAGGGGGGSDRSG